MIARALLLVLIFPGLARAFEVEKRIFEGKAMTVVTVDTRRDDLRLFLADEEGHAYKRFDTLAADLEREGETLEFAVNAGMYHRDFRPVGLFTAHGVELFPLNKGDAPGNFFLKPNGVFFVTRDGGVGILDTATYAAQLSEVKLATQSGPMLVIRGQLHPRFQAESKSELIRNGVGLVSKTSAVFVLAEDPINFYAFARFFRDELGCRDALFLDGTVSSLFLRADGRDDRKIDLGPIIGVVGRFSGAQ